MAVTDNLAILAQNHFDSSLSYTEGPVFDLVLDFSSETYADSSGTNPLPVSNMADSSLDIPWRSLSTNKNWSWFQVDLGAARVFDGAVLVDTNLTTSAKWRVLTSSSPDFVNITYDSGLISARPPSVSYGSLPWGSFPWGGQISSEGSVNPYNIDCFMAVTGQAVRYVRIYIEDENNPDGFVSVGRCILSPIYQPSYNMSYGWNVSWVDESTVTRSYGGAVFADERRRYRRLKVSLDFLTEDEMYLNIFDYMHRRKGIVSDMYVIPQPSKPDKFIFEAMYCRMDSLNPVTNPMHELRSCELSFEEIGI